MSSTTSGTKGFLEPVKGFHLPVQSSTQDKISTHQSTNPTHPEIGLPDLSVSLYSTCQMKLCVMLELLMSSWALCTVIWLVFLICKIIYSDVQSSMVIVVLLNSNTFVLTRELDSVAPKLFIVQHGYISKEFMISNS